MVYWYNTVLVLCFRVLLILECYANITFYFLHLCLLVCVSNNGMDEEFIILTCGHLCFLNRKVSF